MTSVSQRIHHMLERSRSHTDETVQHEAVVDLLVMTVFADDRITQDELESLERFDSEHADWDEGSFSVQQYLPLAIAKVRSAHAGTTDLDGLLDDSAARITSPALRGEAVSYCEEVVGPAGPSEVEKAFIDKVRARLA